LPLEIVLADRVRRQRIGFRTAPFIGLALLRDATVPPGRLRARTIAAARPRALALLEQIHTHEGRTGAFSQDPWPAALVLLGLAKAGAAPHLVEAITGFLRRSVRPDGGWDAVHNLDLTRSAFAATGLIAAGYGADERLVPTRELFHRTQQSDAFTVLDAPPGGWSYSDARGWPVLLESAEILAALGGLPGAAQDPVLASGLDWMTGRQDTRGSWSLWVRDTRLPNDGPCPAITSQAVTALVTAGRGDAPAVAAAVRWLTASQRPDGSFENCWYRDHTSGTAMVLDGLAEAGHADGAPARAARRWLLATQRPDGSWGDGGSAASSVEETAWAVHALLVSGDPDSGPVHRGVGWLLERQRPDGSFDSSRVCAYIRHHMHYPNPAITRGLALRALGTYHRRNQEASS
jgi:squalene-hopene/tetraprenyl-beta-curcumene cyclase